MARKDIRNAITDALLSREQLEVTREVVDAMIQKGGEPDDLQPL